MGFIIAGLPLNCKIGLLDYRSESELRDGQGDEKCTGRTCGLNEKGIRVFADSYYCMEFGATVRGDET